MKNKPKKCVWKLYEDEGGYEASCGGSLYIDSYSPEELGMNFCGYCGKPLEEKA